MIQQVTFKNFKALRDVTVPLAPFTVIVGPNASGKTSILEGLRFLTQLGSDPPQNVFSKGLDPKRLHTVGAPNEMGLSLAGEWNGVVGQLGLSCIPDNPSWESYGHKLLGAWADEAVELAVEPHILPDFPYIYASPTDEHPLLKAVRSAVLLHLDPAKLARPSFTEDMVPSVESDGSNLAGVLADMAIATPTEYQQLQERLRSIVPSVRKVRLTKTKIEEEKMEQVETEPIGTYRVVPTKALGYQILFDFSTGDGLPAVQASEGTLLTVGLLTVMTCPGRPNLVLIDELERGLHPKALGELVRQLREVQKQFPNLQIVGTTHSPYLVDHFQPDEVVLTTLRKDGSVAAGRLNEHPEFDRWKDEMKPGEFWSTVGEDWIDNDKAAQSNGS